jgi:hypothetical protein
MIANVRRRATSRTRSAGKVVAFIGWKQARAAAKCGAQQKQKAAGRQGQAAK